MDWPTVGAFLDKIAENNRSAGSDENQSGSAQTALATAQRVDMAGKIEASIK